MPNRTSAFRFSFGTAEKSSLRRPHTARVRPMLEGGEGHRQRNHPLRLPPHGEGRTIGAGGVRPHSHHLNLSKRFPTGEATDNDNGKMVIDVARTGGGPKSIRLFPGEAPRASSSKVPRPFPKYSPARYPVSSSSFLPQGTRPFDEHPPATHLALLRNQHLRFALNRRCGSFFDLLPTRFLDLARISLAQEDQCNFLCCIMPVQRLVGFGTRNQCWTHSR